MSAPPTPTPTPVPTPLLPPTSAQVGTSRRWLALGVLSLCTLVLNLDMTVLSVGLTTISRDLHASTAQLQWMTAAYSLTTSGLMLTAGALGDRWGRKRVLLGGLVLFAVASLGAAWSTGAGGVIAARAVMGVGAAVVMPLAMSLVRTMFEHHEQGRALGIWTASVAVGMPLGPIVGGLLLDNFWWGSIFLLNVVSVAVAVPLGALLLEESRNPSPGRIDPVGVLLSAAGMAALTYGLVEAQHGWTSAKALGWIAAGLVVLAAFAATQRYGSRPLVDLSLLGDPRFSGTVAILVLSVFALLGVLFIVPLYLQGVLGYRPLDAGLRLLPLAFGVLVSSVVSDRVAKRFGARGAVCAGMMIAAGGLALLASATPTSGSTLIATGLAMAGAGMGLTMGPATATAMAKVPRETAGSIAAMINAIRNMGGVLGVAVVGSAVATLYTDRLPASVDDLPAGSATAVRDSVALVARVSATLGGTHGAALRTAAYRAFTDGMGIVLLGCAAVALFTAVVAAVVLPGRQRHAGAAAQRDPS